MSQAARKSVRRPAARGEARGFGQRGHGRLGTAELHNNSGQKPVVRRRVGQTEELNRHRGRAEADA
jgi:hypothetical protein